MTSCEIAVLIPVYNQLDDLLRTLRSVDSENANLEFFVVDDGSDDTVEVPDDLFQHPVHVITLPENRGCAFARNVGLQEIMSRNFKYVALQDAGDVDVGERMSIQASFLDQNPNIGVVGAWSEYIDLEGQTLYTHKPPIGNREIRARMPFSSAFTHPACMIRVSAIRAAGLYDVTYPNSSDYEMLIRLTRQFESANIPEVLIRKENNPGSLSLGKRRRGLRCRLRAQVTYFDFLSLRSYLGVLTTLAFMMIPYRIILGIKERRGHAG